MWKGGMWFFDDRYKISPTDRNDATDNKKAAHRNRNSAETNPFEFHSVGFSIQWAKTSSG
jgi:hypothetical protein